MKRIKEQDFIVEGIEQRSNIQRNVKIGNFYCCLNNKTYHSLKGLSNAVRPSMTIKEFYDKFYKSDEEGVCKICGKITRFESIIDGYLNYCSDVCSCKSEKHRNAVKNRFVNNPEKLKGAIEKLKKTIEEKGPFYYEEINQKIKSTCLERYGESYYSDKTKRQWSRKSPEDISNMVKKSNETKRRNGTLSSGFSTTCAKRVILKGKLFYCQGYEDQILDFLINDFGFDPEKVHTGKECKRILFNGNKSGYHRPDIFLEELNLYIEVKSNWTFFGYEEFLHSNNKRQQAAIEQGFLHIFFVLLSKITEDDRIKFREVLNMVISSQAQEFNEKVQRLWVDTQYRPIAFGSGSAKHPKWMMR